MFVLECPTTTAPLLLSARSIVTRAVLRARILSSLAYSLLAVSSVRVRVPGTKGVLFRDLSSSSSRQARFLTRRREGPRTAGSQCRSSFDRYLTWREIHCLLRLSVPGRDGEGHDQVLRGALLLFHSARTFGERAIVRDQDGGPEECARRYSSTPRFARRGRRRTEALINPIACNQGGPRAVLFESVR